MRIFPENNMNLGEIAKAVFAAGGREPAKDVDKEQLAIGMAVELEHTDDPHEAEHITRQHLAEDEEYYTSAKKPGWGADEAKERIEDMAKQAQGNVFILEDDPERINIFKSAFGEDHIFLTKSVKEALTALRTQKFAKIFLDRDLSSTTETGEDVAWQMGQEKLCGMTPVVIHSENTRGQRVMARYLGKYHSNVSVIPFKQLRKSLQVPGYRAGY